MRRIVKCLSPEFWNDYQSKHPHCVYSDLENDDEGQRIRSELRAYLIQEQQGICAYCCRTVAEKSAHNEHIKPQSLFANHSMIYDNIVASCNDEQTCGNAKKNDYNEKLFVSPLDEDCATHFYFYPNGMIDGVTEKGKYTIDLLNLNSYSLREQRRAQFLNCLNVHNQDYVMEYYILPQKGQLPRFVDMTAFFYNRGEFTST